MEYCGAGLVFCRGGQPDEAGDMQLFEWQLNIELKMLKKFEDKGICGFASLGLYLPIMLLHPVPSSSAHLSLSMSVPLFGHWTLPPKSRFLLIHPREGAVDSGQWGTAISSMINR